CDVILRLRSVLEMVSREHAGQRVLVVAHQVIVNCMRYLMENLEEHEILAMDKRGDVPNCGVTSYEHDPDGGGMRLDLVNFVAPLRRAGAPVTVEPDALAAPKP
ncbi:MAG TPA: histidine phosphatase family protein, partial [Ramlibacter sp.]